MFRKNRTPEQTIADARAAAIRTLASAAAKQLRSSLGGERVDYGSAEGIERLVMVEMT